MEPESSVPLIDGTWTLTSEPVAADGWADLDGLNTSCEPGYGRIELVGTVVASVCGAATAASPLELTNCLNLDIVVGFGGASGVEFSSSFDLTAFLAFDNNCRPKPSFFLEFLGGVGADMSLRAVYDPPQPLD